MYRNRLTFWVFCLVALLAFPRCLQAQQQVVADKVVAVVGNSMILYSDLHQVSKMLADQRREEGVSSDRDPLCEALERLIIQKILANQARLDSLSIATDNIAMAVENAIEDEIEERGSLKALEQYYHKPIFEIRRTLYSRYEEMQYAMTMERTVKGRTTIAAGDVERFYRRLPKDSLPLIPEQYIYSQILRFPPSLEDAKLRTRTRLLELRERIMNGEKFETLARMYSEDPGSTRRGGEMDPMSPEQFVQPFADAMVKLKPGQVSEIVETEYGFHIIQLIDQPGRNLYHVRHILIKPQFTMDELESSFLLCDSLKKEILAGNTTFEAAAANYSEDKYSRNNGGTVSNLEMMEMMNNSDPRAASTHFLKEELDPNVFNVLKDLKPGDISDPFASLDMRGNSLCKMIRLDEIIPAHTASLSGDFVRVEEMALKKKQDEDYNVWLDKTVEGMFIRINEEYRGCDFEHKSLIK